MIIRSPYPDVDVPEISLPGFVLEHADTRGAAPAVIDAPTGRTLSYRELNSQVRRVAAGLRARGLGRGDVLALCAPNGPEFVITYYAAASAGAAITTVNPVATSSEMAAQLTAAGARIRESFVFGAAGGATPFASLAGAAPDDAPPAISPDDLMLVPFSSGTSGLPKGVMLTHRQLLASLCQTMVSHQVGAGEVVAGVLRMFHVFGMQITMNSTLRAGGTL